MRFEPYELVEAAPGLVGLGPRAASCRLFSHEAGASEQTRGGAVRDCHTPRIGWAHKRHLRKDPHG